MVSIENGAVLAFHLTCFWIQFRAWNTSTDFANAPMPGTAFWTGDGMAGWVREGEKKRGRRRAHFGARHLSVLLGHDLYNITNRGSKDTKRKSALFPL